MNNPIVFLHEHGMSDTEIESIKRDCFISDDEIADALIKSDYDIGALFDMLIPQPNTPALRGLCDFSEKSVEWLVPGWIPKGQICLLAADGGIGKTSIWCDLVAAISSQSKCILSDDALNAPKRVCVVISTEDSVQFVLRKRLREMGADLNYIFAPDFDKDVNGDMLNSLSFGSEGMANIVKRYRPALVVVDPVQGLIPPSVKMAERNAMRHALSPLISLGEKYGTTFLLVCHSNKRSGASGRARIADSADMWDIARSVIMCGFTDDHGIRYASHEKCNYGRMQMTRLFSIDDGGALACEGTTSKKDRDFVQSAAAATTTPKREDCKEFILNEIIKHGGEMRSTDLENIAQISGYSYRTVTRARKELRESRSITNKKKCGVWYVSLVAGDQEFIELPDELTPIDRLPS